MYPRFALEYLRRLLAYPKGKGDEHLSLYLEVADKDSLPDGWSRIAKLTIILINQTNSTMSIKQETKQSLALFSTHAEAEHQFKKGDSGWGFASFFPLSKLQDKNGGYLVDGTCVIEAEVSVTNVFPISTDEPSNYSIHSDQSIDSMSDLDVAESISIKDESFLKLISREPTSSVFDAKRVVPSIEDVTSSVKEHFDKLILLPLDDLVYPKNETAMIETLSTLGNNLSLFSDDRAKQIMQLKANFPITVEKWRDLVQVKDNCQRSLSTSEITKNLLKDSVETKKRIKTQLEELKIREEE
ncbi:MATH domain and coiled-coil domain-containing At3g58360-like isoform X1 [Olea europaea subsp. europaea]|uniref:MATH domain and coiled-coil domain-containing At3g58360-like isoform X1 n=1 Tax=Olea europaea subsp. europaea TaxID=158383 RepID=A0A8S0UIB5_OLEEU|nr:MATH domain and coiled-coil domain-containing At3g58360-like isoform X1 [Olea europaea subsp. europaea]